ncbi:MAG: hypothetical protein HY721_12560 [Planctomycetes bacterium]|nr:hypothetical protein [Planctomycetota bacterium]
MRGTTCCAVVWIGSLFFLDAAPGQVRVSYELRLESQDFPDLDANPVMDGDVGVEYLFTGSMIVSSEGIEGDDGIQGWSCSLWLGGVEVVSLSVEGTVAADASAGGLVDDGFVMYEVVDPAKNGGKTGVVQAVVLAVRPRPVFPVLPPNTSQVVGRSLYRAKVGAPGVIAFIRYEDGLVGSGQPVQNVAPYRGASQYPSLGARRITIGKGAVPEEGRCEDGLDNDGDGWHDCQDPDCRDDASCLPTSERCEDGLDNDRDGLQDCRDPDCSRQAPCLEVCGDGLDNDLDSRADCEDPECAGVPPCPPPERCDDGADNDLDGRTDCEDPDCLRGAPCIAPEACDDGADNDLDGLFDCDDPDCAGKGSCPSRENCRDGLDNDGDGAADCDDPDCQAMPQCRGGGGGGFDLVLSAEGSAREGARNVVTVELVEEASLIVTTSIVPFPGPQPAGVQGWSLSEAHNKKVLEMDTSGGFPTIAGTDAAVAFAGGFQVTEVVETPKPPPGPERQHALEQGEQEEDDEDDEDAGLISAVILAFTQPITLDPTREQSVLRSKYRLLDVLGVPELGPGLVRFRDGLRGSGQPVQNILTVDGRSVAPLHFVPLEIRRAGVVLFRRGDANDDGKVNIADAVWIVNELVRRGPPTRCERAADSNGDGLRDLSDAVYMVHWLFLSGPPIPPPFPGCGMAGEARDPGLACPEGAVGRCP